MQDIDYPGLAKPAPVTSFPLKMSKSDTSIKHRAPLLGEHTDEIMLELGYSSAEISELRVKRVV